MVKTNAREDEEMAMLDKRTVKVRNGQFRETEGFMFTHCYDLTPNLSQLGAKQAKHFVYVPNCSWQGNTKHNGVVVVVRDKVLSALK